jgi:hypothetical protein
VERRPACGRKRRWETHGQECTVRIAAHGLGQDRWGVDRRRRSRILGCLINEYRYAA